MEQHDTAFRAWEVSVRLAVAASPPDDVAPLARATLGEWVGAMRFASDAPTLEATELRDAYALFAEVATGRRPAPERLSPRTLMEHLPAYRNQVIGHGSTRSAEFYDGAATALLAGLLRAWEFAAFAPAGARLVYVDAVDIEAGGARRARLLDLSGLASHLVDGTSTRTVPDDLLPHRVYLLERDRYRSLHPLVLYQEFELRERVLFFNGLRRSAQFLDYAGGETLRGKPLTEAFPTVDADVIAYFGTSLRSTSAEPEEKADPNRFGDYQILGKLGEGGMGVVFLARQEPLGRLVALKMLPREAAQDTVRLARFRREIAALSRCDHPNVVKIYTSGEAQGIPYYAMEYVDGPDLAGIAKALSTADDFERAVSTASDEMHRTREPLFAHLPDLAKPAPASPRQPGAKPKDKDRHRQLAAAFAAAARGLQHLHDAGVIHRDVKPGNLMVTSSDHRMVVMDLGLAAMQDSTRSITQDKNTILGTLRYMSPEQLQRSLLQIDHRADVYSLGATLYELATDKPFLDGDTEPRLRQQILWERPLAPRKASPNLPRDLGTIVEKATEKDPRDRYPTAEAMAEDLEAFVEERPIAARPHWAGYELNLWAKRNRAFAATIVGALVLFAAGSLTTIYLVNDARLRARANEKRADNNAIEVTRQKDEVLRLADVKRLNDLVTQADELWPAYPEKAKALEDWLAKARALASRLSLHQKTLDGLRAKALPGDEGKLAAKGDEIEAPASKQRTWKFPDTEVQWQHDTLRDLVESLEAFTRENDDPSIVTIANVERRLAFARAVRQQTIDDHARDWDEVIASIRDREKCPAYDGLSLTPQLGLIPLGQDPNSHLWEFADAQTGKPAERGSDGRLQLTEATGLVFVLIPGGTLQMGSPPDEVSRRDDEDVNAVTLGPFFLSKYEMTQGQWTRITGKNPSGYKGPVEFGGKEVTLLNPVEQVSWDDCSLVLGRLGLLLPTEAQSQYAARAGTHTAWCTGNDPALLREAANVADAFCEAHGGPLAWQYESWDDGHAVHAPVGSFRENAFGLHDAMGNVWEWCRDGYASYQIPVHPGDGERLVSDPAVRVYRGGSFLAPASSARSAFRGSYTPEIRFIDLGVRPARAITP